MSKGEIEIKETLEKLEKTTGPILIELIKNAFIPREIKQKTKQQEPATKLCKESKAKIECQKNQVIMILDAKMTNKNKDKCPSSATTNLVEKLLSKNIECTENFETTTIVNKL
jgi:hypothetical protein